MPRPLVSVVIPVHNEEENLPIFYERLQAAFEGQGYRTEFIFVEDESTDRTLDVLKDLMQRDPRVKVLILSRSFGQWAAITAGIHEAKGDFIAWISADLQDPPELLPELVQRAREGYDVVWGVRSTREDPLWRRLAARIFYHILRRVALPNYPSLGTDLCCMSRRVAEEFKRLEERNRFTQGLIMSLGFAQTFVPYERQARLRGKSSWNQLEKLMTIGLDMIISFSYKPLRWMLYLGLLLAFACIILALYALFSLFILRAAIPGWTSLMIIIALFGGLNAIMLGILGEYIWRILQEVKRRPLYIIKKKLEPATSQEKGENDVNN